MKNLKKVKEHPILFNTEMVQAVLDGRKKQTRRVIKPQPPNEWDKAEMHPDEILGQRTAHFYNSYDNDQHGYKDCPYGQKSDRLWVRETHYRFGKWIKNGFSKTGKQSWKFCPANNEVRFSDNPPPYTEGNSYREIAWYKRPSIFMPRWASRITLEITDIRVERVQDITLDDCIKEGTNFKNHVPGRMITRIPFMKLWDSINKKRGYEWELNPWVWVVEFKKLESA